MKLTMLLSVQMKRNSLRERLLVLDNMEKLLSTVNRAYNQIYGNDGDLPAVLDTINSFIEEFSSLVKIDTALSPFVQVLQETSAGLSELGHDLYSYLEGLVYYPEEKEEIENRLELYRRLKSKYGATVGEILAFEEQCRHEISILENSEEESQLLEKQLQELQVEIEAFAGQLSCKRKEVAKNLSCRWQKLFKNWGWKVPVFPSALPPKILRIAGKEELEFLFSANREPLKPLVRIISAGEMARVMLALKSILAEQDHIPVLIFDEIDSGIG